MISTLLKKHSFDIVFDSLAVYRLILEAISNPTKIVNIKNYADKLFGDHTVFLAVAMTLLDNEVSFSTAGDSLLSDEITPLTLAKREEVESADFVFISDPVNVKRVIESVKSGTLADPHKSATVIIRDDGAPICRLLLSGPGINGHFEAVTTQTVRDAIILRNAQNYEYPQGIDLIFISEEGKLLAIPRLTRMELL